MTLQCGLSDHFVDNMLSWWSRKSDHQKYIWSQLVIAGGLVDLQTLPFLFHIIDLDTLCC